jgi:hypothetical protein
VKRRERERPHDRGRDWLFLSCDLGHLAQIQAGAANALGSHLGSWDTDKERNMPESPFDFRELPWRSLRIRR